MFIYKHKIGIHITDTQITLYDFHNRIISGPFCKIAKDFRTMDCDICSYSLCYPFRGSVIADFNTSEAI